MSNEVPERRDGLFVGMAIVLGLIAVAPIWSSRFLPLLDEPNHLSAIYIWRGLADPASPLHEFYQARFAPVSYLLHYGLAYLASFVVGVEAAHKLVLSLYVLSIPAAALCWCRATGRSAWLSLLTIPLAFSTSWAHGYHPFDAGVAAFLFGVVAQDALFAKPNWRTLCIAALAGIACYFGHPLTLVLLWLCALVLAVLHRAGWRRLAGSVLSLVPSFALYRWQSRASGIGHDGLRRMLGPDFPAVGLGSFKKRALDFAAHAVNPFAGSVDSKILLALLCLAGVLLGAGMLRERPRLREYRSLVLALVLAAAYFVLPEHFDEPAYLWIARGRLAAPIAFFLLLSPVVATQMRLRWLLLAAALLGAYVPAASALAYRRFGRDMHALEYVLDSCPRDSQILTIRPGGDTMRPPDYNVAVYRELSSWVQVIHGGFNPSAFERPIPFPFVTTKALPAPPWRAHQFYARYLDPSVFGCVLTMNVPQPLPGKRFALARADGPFALYRALR